MLDEFRVVLNRTDCPVWPIGYCSEYGEAWLKCIRRERSAGCAVLTFGEDFTVVLGAPH